MNFLHFADIDHRCEVVEVVGDWKIIGEASTLDSDLLTSIEANYTNVKSRLDQWLNNTARGESSWKMLVEVVADPNGGNNPQEHDTRSS